MLGGMMPLVPSKETRIECRSQFTRRLLTSGMERSAVEGIGYANTVIFSFIFHCWSTSVRMVTPSDISFSFTALLIRLRKRKGKTLHRPLLLEYTRNMDWGSTNPNDLKEKWATFRPDSPGFFDVQVARTLGTADLGKALRRCLLKIRARAPSGCYYGPHSPLIGAFYELLNLRYEWKYILRHLDWVNKSIFIVYMN